MRKDNGITISVLMFGLHAAALSIFSALLFWLSSLIDSGSPIVTESIKEIINDAEFIELYGQMTIDEGLVWASEVFSSILFALSLVLVVLAVIEIITAYFLLQKKEKARLLGIVVSVAGMIFPALLFFGLPFFFLMNIAPGLIILYYLAFDKKTRRLFK